MLLSLDPTEFSLLLGLSNETTAIVSLIFSPPLYAVLECLGEGQDSIFLQVLSADLSKAASEG